MGLRSSLGRARDAWSTHLATVRAAGSVDDRTWEDLTDALLLADIGVSTTEALIAGVRHRVGMDGVDEIEGVLGLLKEEILGRLGGADRSLAVGGSPSVWLFVGVNGVGKTTTIGKLGCREVAAGRSVVFAAGDTFRAAAADQLAVWADRASSSLVRGAEGADPGSVIFDAVEHAAARQFAAAADVTGIVLTKLDGSARGGIVVAVQDDLGIPVKLVGVGEGLDDLVSFDPWDFVDALFAVDAVA